MDVTFKSELQADFVTERMREGNFEVLEIVDIGQGTARKLPSHPEARR